MTDLTSLVVAPMAIPVREVTIREDNNSSLIWLTSRISVLLFVITDERKLSDPTNLILPPNTRPITFPLRPWPTNEFDDDDTVDNEKGISPVLYTF